MCNLLQSAVDAPRYASIHAYIALSMESFRRDFRQEIQYSLSNLFPSSVDGEFHSFLLLPLVTEPHAHDIF